MCGRFTLTAPSGLIEARFRVRVDSGCQPRYNIAPAQPVLCVMASGGGARTAENLRWGLVPSWAKEMKVGHTMINARAETVGQRPAFHDALAKRRCLVLADGFYEWRGSGKSRTPVRFTLASGGPFAFAGLWDTWRAPDGSWVPTCTIITTTANGLIEPVHDRMPVILPDDAEEDWLGGDAADFERIRSLLLPFPAGAMTAVAVSNLVNSPLQESPECILPVATLF